MATDFSPDRELIKQARKCPDCNFENPEGMKFCVNCGVPLYSVCSSCSCISPIQFKFCGNCGTLLVPDQARDGLANIQKYIPSYLAEKIQQSRDHVEGERKNVTVVFADISGFTSMAETHDPEEASAIATICHTMMGKIVYKYEGVVDKIVGDGLMAIFGVSTHEDDPERAILAAIEMQQEMQELSEKLKKSMDISLGLGIGINTGMVVIGDIGTNLRLDYTVIGDVVNTASRLQEEAETGEILVTQETYQRADHFFDFKSLKPIYVKGKNQPIQAYKVIRQKEKPSIEHETGGLKAPLIGRDKEFALCTQVLKQLVAGKGGTMLITGEAGLGKSRIAKEFRDYVNSHDVTWLEGRCASLSRSINYWVFADALKNYFGIKNRDDIVRIRRKIKKKKSMENVEASVIPTISFLLSSESKTESGSDDLPDFEKKLRLFTVIRDVLAAESQIRPLILVLEDLHWADEHSIELLFFLMDELAQHRVTFVCIYRPPIAGEADTRAIQKLEEHYLESSSDSSEKYTRIVLEPLSSDDSRMLLDSLLVAEELPIEIKELVLGKSSGNPLYLEEITKSIIDDGAIEQCDGKWRAVKELEDIAVPSTIQGVIMSRIDRLEEKPKHVLQCASVIGSSSQYDLLSYLVNEGMPPAILHLPGNSGRTDQVESFEELWRYGDTDRIRGMQAETGNIQNNSSDLDEHLEKLEKMGFVSREESGEITFRHLLIQDVAYSTILIRRRKELHEMICRYIEEVHSDRLDEFYEILAYHYIKSNNTEASLSYLIKAGDKNRNSYTGSAESALRYFHRGLNILEDSSLKDDDRMTYKHSIHNGIGEAYKDLGKYEMALSSFETVFSIAEHTRDRNMKAEALRQIANSKTQLGKWEAALENYKQSLAIGGDYTQMGLVYICIGDGYFRKGELNEAMEHFQEALKIGQKSGDLRVIGDASNGLGTLASIRHDFDEAIRDYQVSLNSYNKLGESHYVAQTYLNLGVTHFKKDEIDIADSYYEESLKISERCGYSRLTAYIYLNRAEVYIGQLKLDKAITFCERAFQMLRTLEDNWALAEGYKLYGMIYRRRRVYQSASKAFHTSLKVSEECGNLPNMAEVHCELGLMYKEERILQKALEHFSQSREIFEELDITEEIQNIDAHLTEITPSQAAVSAM